MKTKSQPQAAQIRSGSEVTRKFDTIKLGIDWHAHDYWVTRIIDGAGPEPAQKFTPKKFLQWVAKQRQLAQEVISCYEAGCGGFVLHRELEALGVINHVVAPRKLDPEQRRVKTDKLDSRNLTMDLDRFVRGNPKALRLVRVPSPEEEQRRQESRQREQLRESRLSHAAQGRTLLLSQGYRVNNRWWQPARWSRLREELEDWLVERLEIFREVILLLDAKVKELSQSIKEAASEDRPKGMGALTEQILEREVLNWNRFENRKQPGSYIGLVGSVHGSGGKYVDGSLTKAGHRRLRTTMVELAWRWVRYQPQCPLIAKSRHILLDPKAHKGLRKKAIVAVARQLFVDLWRWKTGRITPAELGWRMVEQTPTES